MKVRGREITTVAIVDDEDKSRESLRLLVEDSDLEAYLVGGPLGTLANAEDTISPRTQALICDHQLNARSYATFSGADLVSATVKDGFISLLCTAFLTQSIDVIRPLLPNIPVVLSWEDLNETEQLIKAFNICAAEIDGIRSPERRPWRTQIVVEQVDPSGNAFYMSVPAWEIDESIRIGLSDVPEELRGHVRVGFRTHVRLNLGATTVDSLFVESWTT